MAANCCDLHIHSTKSDGSVAPREIVRMAREMALGAVSITDHDTAAGTAEALEAGREFGVTVIPGVEISVEFHSKTVHMLGYCFGNGAQRLQQGLDTIVEGRNDRNRKIVGKLNELGLGIAYEEIEAEADGGIVGRPHFAAVMLRKGCVATRQEAFDRYLARGAAAYVDRLRFSPEDSVVMIRESGGIPVLAHPKFIPLAEGETLEQVVQVLVDAGLAGIECYYSLHTDEETREYLDLAKRFGLVVTGGSDFHGASKPDIALGSGMGALRVPMECAEALQAAVSNV